MSWTPEATKAANFLASLPCGNTTLGKKDTQSLLSESGGQLMARGSLYDIKAKHLGAGIYKISLDPWR